MRSNICNDGGTFCVQRDNEGFYGVPADESNALAGLGMPCSPCDSRGCASLLFAGSFLAVCALSDLTRPSPPAP